LLPLSDARNFAITHQRQQARVRLMRIEKATGYGLLTSVALVLLAGNAVAAEEEERTTGLPSWGQWKFNFDAGAGVFGFDNSLYTNPHADPSGNLSDNWFESFIKPALSLDLPLEGGSVFFGKLSAVGERTFSAPPTVVGESASSLLAEDVYVGWRSGTTLGIGEDALEITLGRAPYKIGHGFLLWDGAAEGGTRGGYWSGARKAWEYAAIGQFKAKNNTLQVFYLDRDELPESDTGTKLWGANYELSLGENTTFGLTYLNTQSDELALRDGMDVVDGRLFTAPLSVLPDLSFELEYAKEESGSLLSAEAYTAGVTYKLSKVGWTPQLTYRYASFQGDDPATPRSEGFDSLFTGFYDWGSWWQGEIAGEFFLSNSNLISNQLRLHLTPNEHVSGGLIGYDFRADQPASFGTGVTSADVGVEVDGYIDWKVNGNLTASFVLAYAEPGKALEQGFGRTDAFHYGMVYLAYAF
jgi:hypothetical protein